MSLVHQVLRNIDERRDEDLVIVPDSLRMSADDPYQQKRWLILAVAVVVGIAALGGWYILTENVSAEPDTSPVIVDQKAVSDRSLTAPETMPKPSPQATSEPAQVNSVVTNSQADTAHNSKSVMSEQTNVPLLTKSDKASGSDIIGHSTDEASDSGGAAVLVAADNASADEGSHLLISQRGQQFVQNYSQMLSQMRDRQWQQAEITANALLADDFAEAAQRQKVMHNKLRILLEQDNFEAFLDFYTHNKELETLAWLSTAAPGLHMIGAYEESVLGYQKLIRLQPRVVNWPIAMSLALEKQGKQQQAHQVLAKVIESYPLLPDQKEWIRTKLSGRR